MVRINTESVFQNVDLDNADSVRRIMVGLDYYLTNQVLSHAAPERRALQGPERSVTNIVLSRIRMEMGYPLLLEAVLRFIEARNGTDEQVLTAARDLETLAPGEVLLTPQLFPAEYAAAEARFNRTRAVDNFMAAHQRQVPLEERAPGAFGQHIFSSRTGEELEEQKRTLHLQLLRQYKPFLDSSPPVSSNDSSSRGCIDNDRANPVETGTEALKPKNDTANRQTKAKRRNKDDQESFQQRVDAKSQGKKKGKSKTFKSLADRATTNKRKSSTNLEELDSDLSSASSSGALSDDSEFDASDNELNEEVENERHPFRPLRTAGDIVVDDGSHDRKPCRVGIPQPEKLVIEFQVVRKDPKDPRRVIAQPNIQFKYRRYVDWKNKKSVGELTRWRGQIFLRSLGKKRDGRQVWLESERDIFLAILEAHIKEVGGRWSRIDWDVVAKRFNKRLKGVIQRAGEMTAERRYDNNIQRNSTYPNSKSLPLKEDRKAPIRSSSSLHTQISYFTIPRAKQIKQNAKAEDQKARAAEGHGEEDLSGSNGEEDYDNDDPKDGDFMED